MKYPYKFIYSIFLISVLLLFSGCTAPRNNPLDPINEENNLADISGMVKTISFPNTPLPDVQVYLQSENLTTFTDQNGVYYFRNIKRNPGLLIYSHPDYVTDSVNLSFGTFKEVKLDVFLNALPEADSIQLYSIVQNRFQFTQLYEINVSIMVSDPDGFNDIDTVFITTDLLAEKVPLNYNAETQFYDKVFSPQDLNISFLDEVIGKEFGFIVKDLASREFNVGSSTVKRVIKEEIELLSPVNNETVEQPVVLSWKRFTPGYAFDYYLEIYTNQSPAELVWESGLFSSDEISFTVNTTFPPGEYFWVLWVMDEFLNRARSKPATFNLN